LQHVQTNLLCSPNLYRFYTITCIMVLDRFSSDFLFWLCILLYLKNVLSLLEILCYFVVFIWDIKSCWQIKIFSVCLFYLLRYFICHIYLVIQLVSLNKF
jgi:hypothetical protein